MSFNRKELKESHDKLIRPTKKGLNKNLKEESKIGYSGDTPSAQPWMDIYTPSGLIDMTDTNVPVLAQGMVLPPNSGMYQFDTPVVREYRMQRGGSVKSRLKKYPKAHVDIPKSELEVNDPFYSLENPTGGEMINPLDRNFGPYYRNDFSPPAEWILQNNQGYLDYLQHADEGRVEEMRKGGEPSAAKAREMLHNPPHGRELTDKQRRYFGYLANRQEGGEWLQKYQEVGQVDPRFQPGLGFVKNFQQQQAAAEAYTNKAEGTTPQQRQVAAGINPLTGKPIATGMTDYPMIDPITAIMLPIAPEIAGLGKLGNFALGALNPLEGISFKDIRKLGKGSLKKVSDDIQNRLYNASYKAGAWKDAAQGVIDKYNPYFGKDINKITPQNLKRHLGKDLSLDPTTGTRIGGFNTGVYEMKKNPNYAIKFESPNHPYFDDYKNIHYPDFFEGINSPNVAKVHKQMDIPKKYHPEPWLIDYPETEARTLIMNKVPGKVLERVRPAALRRIPADSYGQMFKDVDEIIKNKKFDIDLSGANIAYDPTKKSFGFYDLSPKTTANTSASQSWQRDVVSGLNPDAPDYKEELKNMIYKAMKNKSDFSMRNYLREYGKRLSREDREMFESEHLDKIYSNIEEGLKGLKKGGGWLEHYQNGKQVPPLDYTIPGMAIESTQAPAVPYDKRDDFVVHRLPTQKSMMFYEDVATPNPSKPGLNYIKQQFQDDRIAQGAVDKLSGTTEAQRAAYRGINPNTGKPYATGMAEYIPLESLMLPVTPEITALGRAGNVALDILNPLSNPIGISRKNMKNLMEGIIGKKELVPAGRGTVNNFQNEFTEKLNNYTRNYKMSDKNPWLNPPNEYVGPGDYKHGGQWLDKYM